MVFGGGGNVGSDRAGGVGDGWVVLGGGGGGGRVAVVVMVW